MHDILSHCNFFKRLYDPNIYELTNDIIHSSNCCSLFTNHIDLLNKLIYELQKCFQFEPPPIPIVDQIYNQPHKIKYSYFDKKKNKGKILL